MSTTTEQEPSRVHYVAGGFPQSRAILTGADAKETFDGIPVIDFSNVLSPSLETRQALAREVGNATQNVGFFYAVNHPVSREKIDRAFEVIEKFFRQPDEVKLQIDYLKSNAAKGYLPRQAVGPHGVLRETFSMGNDYTEPEQQNISVTPEDAVSLNQWPDKTIPEFRQAMYDYCKQSSSSSSSSRFTKGFEPRWLT